ncbi:hypothetical protein EVAR_74291_1 [Eumeta japonica]|uniref:Uncharacterized protein n=1 Tax=Eumeta variegata TaxID=151549 RepID=A0A4C1SEX3_EUMVA|nr:hypothetical protein EVAR_74291_1 [Eumeta japonica]
MRDLALKPSTLVQRGSVDADDRCQFCVSTSRAGGLTPGHHRAQLLTYVKKFISQFAPGLDHTQYYPVPRLHAPPHYQCFVCVSANQILWLY